MSSPSAAIALAAIRRTEDDVFAQDVATLGRQLFPDLPSVETRWTLRGRTRWLTLRMDSDFLDAHVELRLPVEQRDGSELAEWKQELSRAARELRESLRTTNPREVARQDAAYRAAGGRRL